MTGAAEPAASAGQVAPSGVVAEGGPEPLSRLLGAADHTAARAEFAYYAHANLQEMVKLADQKAASIIAAGGIIVAVLGSNLIDKVTRANFTLAVAATISVVLLVSAVVCAVLVLMPRFPSEEDVLPVVGAPRVLWAKDIAAYHRRPAEFARGLLALAPADAVLDLAYENLKITWLLNEKWKWQRGATLLLLAAFIAWAVTIGLAFWR